jgi:CRISPR-associated endonuclease/helicase Cas3
LFFRLLFSCLIDADRLDTERFANPEQYRLRQERVKAVTISQLWETFQRQQQKFIESAQHPTSRVNRVRSQVYKQCLAAASQAPGVFRLCVPTGGGKTRSGLAFALKHAQEHNKDRVIFAVPYTSIIEQTAKVYRDEIFAGIDGAVLEHHSAIDENQRPVKPDDTAIESDENTLRSKEQAKLVTQNWDAKLIVTTTVQLFESLFANSTKRCRKLHNMVNSVIVLDEVQTLPIKLLAPILSGLKELVDRYGVTVVLCTATQPALEGETPYFKDGFPAESVRDIIPPAMVQEHFQVLQRVNYEVLPADTAWTWDDLVADMPSEQSSLVVLNTRPDAIALLDALDVPKNYSCEPIAPRVEAAIEESSVLHLSTLLCGQHRRVVLAKVNRRLAAGELCKLVSTQVVEAGVDLDFPVMYRAMGPLDRIVQAAGRCNRNGNLMDAAGKTIPGRVVIFNAAKGKQPPPGEYAKAISRARILLEADDFQAEMLHQPDIFQAYFEQLYSDMSLDGHKIQELRQGWNFRDVGERFRLIAQGTTPIVIQYDEAVIERLKQIEQRGIWNSDWAFLQSYTISLPDYLFSKLEYKELVRPDLDLWKWTGNYDPIRGFPLAQADQSIVEDPMFLVM